MNTLWKFCLGQLTILDFGAIEHGVKEETMCLCSKGAHNPLPGPFSLSSFYSKRQKITNNRKQTFRQQHLLRPQMDRLLVELQCWLQTSSSQQPFTGFLRPVLPCLPHPSFTAVKPWRLEWRVCFPAPMTNGSPGTPPVPQKPTPSLTSLGTYPPHTPITTHIHSLTWEGRVKKGRESERKGKVKPKNPCKVVLIPHFCLPTNKQNCSFVFGSTMVLVWQFLSNTNAKYLKIKCSNF